MADEELNLFVDTTSEPDATVAPALETETPEEQPVEQQRVFTQEDLDAAIGKRLAREQRKWEREQASRVQTPAQPVEVPSVDYFSSPEEYAEALAEQKAVELVAKRDAEKQRTAYLEAYHDREEDARNKYDDFEQVAYNPKLPITDTMAQTIQLSDIGPDVVYYLGSNPKEAQRISQLPPLLQAREIGKIESKIADNPPVKKTSNAPAPITPVTARANGTQTFDTTDPRSIKAMSTSEWIEAERLRQVKKWDAQNKR